MLASNSPGNGMTPPAAEQKTPRRKKSGRAETRDGVTSGARTHDLLGHNQVLCQLSYGHHTTFVQPALLTAVIGQKCKLGDMDSNHD